MKKIVITITLLFYTSFAQAHNWSVSEYLDNCSVVHQKMLNTEDKEIAAYCMGVLKGVFTGILYSKILREGELDFPVCMLTDGDTSFWNVQKDVMAVMRTNSKGMSSKYEPNTANAAVAEALIQLYPCLLE